MMIPEGTRPDPRVDTEFLYFQHMLRNSESGLAGAPGQSQQSGEHSINQQSNNFIFSVLLNSLSQSEQGTAERPSFNPGGMEFERPPDNRDGSS